MKMNREENILLVAVGLLLIVFILAVGLAYERGHNSGYTDGWYDGRADSYDTGWRHCIEENNLYERYYEYN